MQISDLVPPLGEMSDEELQAKILEVRAARRRSAAMFAEQKAAAASAKKPATPKKAAAAPQPALLNVLKNLDPEALARLKALMGGG